MDFLTIVLKDGTEILARGDIDDYDREMDSGGIVYEGRTIKRKDVKFAFEHPRIISSDLKL